MINLYSDTQTRPTDAMRRVMAAAPVGDEQRGEDPSVNRLCEQVADLLGKEAAVFMPSGTMCNEVAIRVHCRPGDEVIAEESSHIINFEGGGPAALSGVMIRALPGEAGVFTAAAVAGAIREPSRYAPRSRLVAVEQTANLGGGTVWPRAELAGVAAVARRHGLATHMDGARLLNAAVAAGVPARDFADGFDTAWVDLSKGLGCPVGAVLAGSRDLVEEAWRWKQRLGGAMRQAGILAAAGTYALDHHVERLAEDHRNAARLAAGLAEIRGVAVEPERVQTNIVFFDLSPDGPDAASVCRALDARGVRVGAMGERRIRAVTHLDVGAEAIDEALRALRAVIA